MSGSDAHHRPCLRRVGSTRIAYDFDFPDFAAEQSAEFGFILNLPSVYIIYWMPLADDLQVVSHPHHSRDFCQCICCASCIFKYRVLHSGHNRSVFKPCFRKFYTEYCRTDHLVVRFHPYDVGHASFSLDLSVRISDRACGQKGVFIICLKTEVSVSICECCRHDRGVCHRQNCYSGIGDAFSLLIQYFSSEILSLCRKGNNQICQQNGNSLFHSVKDFHLVFCCKLKQAFPDVE